MSSVIDLETDALVPVARLVEQRLGRRLSPPTHWRWRVKGVRGVRLEAYLIGGVWHTTSKALAEFIRASSAASLPADDLPAESHPVDDAQPARDPATERRLRKAGLIAPKRKQPPRAGADEDVSRTG